MLLKTSVYSNGAKLGCSSFYERILPSLTTQSLLASKNFENAEFRPVPAARDRSFVYCVLEAIRYIAHGTGFSSVQCDLYSLIVKWQGIKCVIHDLDICNNVIATADLDIIRISVQNLALCAGKYGQQVREHLPIVTKRLFLVSETIQEIDKKLDTIERSVGRSYSMLPKFKVSQDIPLRGVCTWLWYGRLRRDAGVDHLAGNVSLPPIQRPVELTLVPDTVASFADVTSAMRHALNNCVLLANQISLIRNSFTLRVCLLQHLFVRVLPLPLPINHPNRNSQCFWAAQPMRYETQADIMRLLNMLSRHFAAASLSIRCTRSGDAARMLTCACMAAIGDAVLRKVACDIPAQSSLHYAGAAMGPVQPFGFDLGHFSNESEYLQFNTPENTVGRTMVLDYFTQMKSVVSEDHIMFKFESGNVCGSADKRYIDQLCLQMGFERGSELEFITGENTALLDLYPEIGFFRDLVFMFKLTMVPTSDALPELRQWSPSDAAFKWTSSGGDNFVVTGFNRKLECTVANIVVEDDLSPNQQQIHGGSNDMLSRFMRLMGKGQSKPRAPLSKANPSILVGERVETEDDILHIRILPDFDGTLGARECELMLQYLTAPYLRIPLLMGFFSNESRLRCLKSKELQEVLDAALFEPGRWQSTATMEPPLTVPAPNRAHICTPTGLLFNEILESPRTVLESVQQMLDYSIDMDSGKHSEIGEVILYVTRLAVRVEGYALYLIKNYQFHFGRKDSNRLSGAYYESTVRGLDTTSDIITEVTDLRNKLKNTLGTKVFKILVRWIKKAKQEGKVYLACMLHAHICFIFRNVESVELNSRIVFTMLGSQIFLYNNYKFDLELETNNSAESRKIGSRQDAEGLIKSDLSIPQVKGC